MEKISLIHQLNLYVGVSAGQWPSLASLVRDSFPSYGSPLDLNFPIDIFKLFFYSHAATTSASFWALWSVICLALPDCELVDCALTKRFNDSLPEGFEPLISSWCQWNPVTGTGLQGSVLPFDTLRRRWTFLLWSLGPWQNTTPPHRHIEILPPFELRSWVLSTSALYWWLRPRFFRTDMTGLPSFLEIGGLIP